MDNVILQLYTHPDLGPWSDLGIPDLDAAQNWFRVQCFIKVWKILYSQERGRRRTSCPHCRDQEKSVLLGAALQTHTLQGTYWWSRPLQPGQLNPWRTIPTALLHVLSCCARSAWTHPSAVPAFHIIACSVSCLSVVQAPAALPPPTPLL